MVSNNIKDIKQIKRFVFMILLVSFIVGLTASVVSFKTGIRASAPFEGPGGEANTLAGYIVLIMGITLGLFLYIDSAKLRLITICLFMFLIVPFIYTLSRGGWISFFAMYAAFIIFARHKRNVLLIGVFFAVFLAPFVLPNIAVTRYHSTFVGGKNYNIFGRKITIDEAGEARITSSIRSLEAWAKNPILGEGIPGKADVTDVQYTRVLREVGIIGCFSFIWIIATILRITWRNHNNPGMDRFAKGITLGYLCSLIGLLIMGVSSEVFIIIRIMEPFWFLTAVIIMIPEINKPFEIANA